MKNLNDGNSCIAIYIDIAKAFDSVDHSVLIAKLIEYGIDSRIIKIIHLFVNSRCVNIKFDNIISKTFFQNTGVPQGSSVGPLLFLIFINSIISTIHPFHVTLFADDAVIVIPGKENSNIISNTNECMGRLQGWFDKHKLNINLLKTKYMYFTNKAQKLDPYHIKYKDSDIDECLNYRYLGIITDSDLRFNDYVDSIIKKLIALNAALYRCRYQLPIDCAITAYHSICTSLLN